MNKSTIMDKLSDMLAFVKAMHEMEDAYVEVFTKNGEPTHVGYTPEWNTRHKFCEDKDYHSFDEWYEGICTGVMKRYLEDPYDFGCNEIADSLACLECGCRNYSLCAFLYECFEDAKEFMQYCIDYEK